MRALSMDVTGGRDLRVSVVVGNNVHVTHASTQPGERLVDTEDRAIGYVFHKVTGRKMTGRRWDGGVRVTAW